MIFCHNYDKEPLRFKPLPCRPSRARFARSKSGHVGIDQMKRYNYNKKEVSLFNS